MRALYTEMLDKARQRPETLYGSSPAQIARGKIQTLAVADEFPSVMQDLIAVGVKTHFIYYVVAKNNGYKAAAPGRPRGPPRPDGRLRHRLGPGRDPHAAAGQQLPGVRAAGQPEEPDLHGLLEGERPAGRRARHDRAGHGRRRPPAIGSSRTFRHGRRRCRRRSTSRASTGRRERYHANWDGNQGASSRTLASGASATGDPRMVNVRIHEPLNPFIDNLPPPPYPFGSVDLARAREGKAIFKTTCASLPQAAQPERSTRPRRWASIRTGRW